MSKPAQCSARTNRQTNGDLLHITCLELQLRTGGY